MPRIEGFYRTVWIIWAAHFLVDVMIGFWPVYKTLADLDLALAGLIGGICAFMGESTQLFFGNLSDRGYAKQLILIGLCLTLGSVFFPYVSGYGMLAFCVFLTCLGSGAFHPSAAMVIGSLSVKRKGLWITFFASGGALGLAFSQLIFSQSYALFHGNTLWLVLPALTLTGFALFFPLPALYRDAPKGSRLNREKLRLFFRNRPLVTLYFHLVFNQTVFWGLLFLLPDILLTRGYESWIVYGGGHLFTVIGGAFMMIPGGMLADRYSARSVLFTATIASMLLGSWFLLSPGMSSALLLVVLFLMGAALGVVSPVGISYGHHLSPRDAGLVSGVLMGMVWCISELVGPAAGGMLTKLFLVDAPAKAALVMGSCLIASCYFILRLPSETRERSAIA